MKVILIWTEGNRKRYKNSDSMRFWHKQLLTVYRTDVMYQWGEYAQHVLLSHDAVTIRKYEAIWIIWRLLSAEVLLFHRCVPLLLMWSFARTHYTIVDCTCVQLLATTPLTRTRTHKMPSFFLLTPHITSTFASSFSNRLTNDEISIV